jgi:hypothetical protein
MKKNKLVKNKKYILCRPVGGLNDIFCQIEKCWQYAEKYNRILIVDTHKSQGLLGQNFLDFFFLKNKIQIVFTVNKHIKFLNSLSCFPKKVQNNIRKWHYFPNRQITTFNFNKNYDESLLYHESTSGGVLSHRFLNRIKLNSNVKLKVKKYLARKLNFEYVGVHIRNTDLQTDYDNFFTQISNKISAKNILICTDNRSILTKAKIFLSNFNVYNNEEMKNETFVPIHTIKRYSSNKEKKKIVINSIIDLISLGFANKLYISRPLYVNFSKYNLLSKIIYKLIRFTNGIPRRLLIFIFERFLNHNKKNSFSGYSMLALFLNKNKNILKKLTNI